MASGVRTLQQLLAFNRGLLSKLALARTDLKRTGLSAEEQTNWMPNSLGSMMLRPGLGYVGATKSNAAAVHIPFVFSLDDTAIIELTSGVMRVRVDEAVITRASVSTAVSNGTFDTDLTGWTDSDEAGATSAWLTGGFMMLTGTGYNAAIRTQQVTVSGGDQNKEHALRVVVAQGIATLRVGSSSGAEDYVAETELRPGTHSLAFTPTGNFHIQLSNRRASAVAIDSVTVEASGAMEITTPWLTANLPDIRWDQSGDVLFVACSGFQQRRIERRSTRSWSVVLYQPEDGPFRPDNASSIRLTPSALTGDITLSASAALFRSTHVGALFRITSAGQRTTLSASGAGQWTDPVRVSGVGNTRLIAFNVTGTWSGTVTLQRSLAEPGTWSDVNTYTSNGSYTYNDELDNQVAYYRIGIDTGDYSSGTAVLELVYASGSLTGIVRITGFTNSTSASAAVLKPLGELTASEDWAEGSWSTYRGFPTAVCLYEGRLWWAGRDRIYGSVSDAFDSFDDEVEGDSGPINRSIGSGPVDVINWLLPLQRLVIGTQGAEHSARSSTFDEPLTPTTFNIKAPSTQGSSAVAAVKIDGRGVFVHKSGTRLFELAFDSAGSNDYASGDLSLLCPEAVEAGISRIAVQRQPETRVHCVLADGTAAVLVTDPAEEVRCWVKVETDGEIEDAFVLPGDAEDKVYYLVKRTVNAGTVRYLERWALESECQGGTLNRQADSFVTYTGSSTTTVTAAHLAGEEVVVWGDGADLGTVTLNGSGQATLASGVTNYVVGLPYTARYKSVKLAYGAQVGLAQRKRVDHLAVILSNTHAQGLRYGADFDNLDDLPLVENGAEVDGDTVHTHYDEESFEFNGTWDSDSRICLEASAPRPVTVLGVIYTLTTNEKI